MRYSPKGADDIHDCVVMIYQACGLDKQKENICLPTNVLFLLAEAVGFEPTGDFTRHSISSVVDNLEDADF